MQLLTTPPPQRIPLLDHGYIRLIETWGSDERIVEAARMSTGKGFLGWDPGPCSNCLGRPGQEQVVPLFQDNNGNVFVDFEGDHLTENSVKTEWVKCRTCNGKATLPGDMKLLDYLWSHKHATPFEMAGMVIEIQAPIFVFREWHRHRTQSYNEMSARYTPLPNLNYVPTIERLMINAGASNRQAGTIDDAAVLTAESAESFQYELLAQYKAAEVLYQRALKAGVPKELARVHLPVGRYSRMRASTNLRNWLAFLTLRMAPDAQWEIRQYANTVGSLIREAFPRTWEVSKLGAA